MLALAFVATAVAFFLLGKWWSQQRAVVSTAPAAPIPVSVLATPAMPEEVDNVLLHIREEDGEPPAFQETWVDLRTMRLGLVGGMLGKEFTRSTIIYLLRREPTGWMMKFYCELEDDDAFLPRRFDAEAALEHKWHLLRNASSPELERAFEEDVVQHRQWVPVPDRYVLWLTEIYEECLEFFRKHPGLHPGNAGHERAGAANHVWQPPVHTHS